MRHARRSSHSLGRSPRRGTRRDGIPSHASAHDTVEDIFRVSFTGVKYNEMGYYYLFDGRWEVSPTSNLFNAYSATRVQSLPKTTGHSMGTAIVRIGRSSA